MMSLTQILLYLKLLWENRFAAALASLVLTISVFYLYHLKTAHTIETLNKDRTELQQVVEKQEKQMKVLVENYKRILASRKELERVVQKSKDELDALRDKLFRENRGKHSLEDLARKKPTLVEKIINAATQKTLKCFESLSNGDEC